MGEACSTYERQVRRVQGLDWDIERKGPLGRPRLRWQDNINVDPQEAGCVIMDWIELAQDRDR